MGKPWFILFLILACLWTAQGRGRGSEAPLSNQELPPMPQTLHAVVAEAEKKGDSGDPAAAAAVLTDYLKAHPEERHPYPYYDAGYFFHLAGNQGSALKWLRRAVDLRPSFHEAWTLMASLYQKAGEPEKAAQAMEKAASISNSPETWRQAGLLYLEAACPEKGLAALKQIPADQRNTAKWHVAAAHAHQDLKQFLQAAQAMASAHALSKDPAHLYQCAVFYLEAERPADALPLLRQLAETRSPRPDWLVALSHALKALEKKEETARTMEQAARLSRDPNLLFHAACLWLEADRPQKALGLLKELARRKPLKIEWLLALANAHIMLDQMPQAALAMDRAVHKDPQSDYLYRAGVLWLHADRPQKALDRLSTLCRRSPAKPEWFVALSHAYLAQEELVQAAKAMEDAASLGNDPEHAFQAGLMWLKARQADEALRLLIPLSQGPAPKAEWLAALSSAWAMKQDYVRAARAMEQAGRISGSPDHLFQAAQLWMEADQPKKAQPLLEGLTALPNPRGEWYAALSTCCLMLDAPDKAAAYREKAADITHRGEDYGQAGLLYLQIGNKTKGIHLLKKAAGTKPVQQKWLVTLAQALIEAGQEKEALTVMDRTSLADPAVLSETRYQGALLWLCLNRHEKALPILEGLCASAKPARNWLVSLVETCVEADDFKAAEKALKRLIDLYPEDFDAWRLAVWVGLQENDYAKAAAAMAVAVRLAPPDADLLKKLADLYHMAGAPTKAARTLQGAWKEPPSAEDWDRLVNIYLSGHRYEPALACARSAVKAEATAKRWETIGDIAYRLQRFDESLDAYCRGAALSPDADIRLKAAYAALKMDRLKEASRLCREAMRRAGKDSRIAYEAHRNMAFVEKLMEMRETDG